MLKTIVFTKNRPMQLEAYLQSLFHYTDITHVDVITPKMEDYFYHISGGLPAGVSITPIAEDRYGSFDTTLRHVVGELKDDDVVLFGVDDVVWLKQADIDRAANSLKTNKHWLGFSFKLGTNVDGYDIIRRDALNDGRIIQFNWLNKPGDWGYPFEVMSTLFMGSTVKEIINWEKTPFRLPNDLEGRGVNWCFNTIKLQVIALNNNTSYAAAVDINRVQDLYQNQTNGTDQTTSENLLKLYYQGFRINWKKYENTVHNRCFLGTKNLEISKPIEFARGNLS